jgi:hypothetical protein
MNRPVRAWSQNGETVVEAVSTNVYQPSPPVQQQTQNMIVTDSYRPIDCQALDHFAHPVADDQNYLRHLVSEYRVFVSDAIGPSNKTLRMCGACRDRLDQDGQISFRVGGFVVVFHPTEGMPKRTRSY